VAKILVTGAHGQVGQELKSLVPQFHDFDIVFVDVQDLDITDPVAVQQYFAEHRFDYCINCAAFTAVDKAETEKDLAYKVNVEGVKNLVTSCLIHSTQFLQLSTDYVYHNNQNTPFKEGDPTNPQGVYASTKLQGDEIALQILPSSMIVRTSWVYSTFGNNFVKTMIRLGKERDKLDVIFDQIGTPTYAYDLALAMLTIIQKVEIGVFEKSTLAGVFHYSNEGVTSWYDFAKAIFRIENINCKVNPIETVDYPTPAKRPPFSLLNKHKIKTTFAIEIPHWEKSLAKCLENLKTV
jgi:dTDP-4-dehydrorhamnose reductase